jgi:hypothetical protein
MSIDFSKERYVKIEETYEAWWNKKLKRPICGVVVRDRDPKRPCPNVPLLSKATCGDFEFTADQVVDRLDYELSQNSYYGDAFPYIYMADFGAGIMAAFLGCKVVIDKELNNVWFFPDKKRELSEMHFTYNPDNIWLKRIKDIYKASINRWDNKVILSMPDLGGPLDVLAAIRGSEDLLMDLYDNPDEVKRLTKELDKAWMDYFNDINGIILPFTCGHSDWAMVYSKTPSYITQCDFSYMISNEMFKEFVLSSINYSCENMNHILYHLDGIGQLAHLDTLLSIDKLDGIQWVPGEGNKPFYEWPEIYRKIIDAGKLPYAISFNPEDYMKLLNQFDSDTPFFSIPFTFDAKDKDYALSFLNKLKVPK